MSVVLGLDVAEERGCDAVILGSSMVARPIGRVRGPDEFRALLDEVGPAAVAIDSPPRWAPHNERRACERELTKRLISLFTTPDADEGTSNPFYAWMQVGFQMFEAALDYPTLETFPYAVAVAIHGCRPAGTKNQARRAALTAVGVSTRELRNIDEVDAALCAYTAWAWLHGTSVSVGDEVEGQITLPVTSLPERYVH